MPNVARAFNRLEVGRLETEGITRSKVLPVLPWNALAQLRSHLWLSLTAILFSFGPRLFVGFGATVGFRNIIAVDFEPARLELNKAMAAFFLRIVDR